MFPYLIDTRPPVSFFPRKTPTAFVCTMNVSEQMMKENYGAHIGANEHVFGMMFGHAESSFANETLQFEDMTRRSSATSTRMSAKSGGRWFSLMTAHRRLNWVQESQKMTKITLLIGSLRKNGSILTII